jgi:hypothetical protein
LTSTCAIPSSPSVWAGWNSELRYSILPILIGSGIPFFERLDRDVPLHLAEVKAYRSGMVELRYEVSKPRDRPSS